MRDGFVQAGKPKMLFCKHGGSRVKLSLWPFCARIPGPTENIWASFESLKLQSVLYFASRTGWPDTDEKIYEMTTGGLPLSWNGRIAQNYFGHERGNLRSTRLALITWLKRDRRKK